MANTIDKSMNIPQPKTHFFLVWTQIFLRILAFATTIAATCIILTSKQTEVVYGVTVEASYSYASAFKFFGYANLITCVFSFLSFLLALIIGTKEVLPIYYYYIFLHDLVMGFLLMAGCSAAIAIAYVGKYGYDHTGWLPICEHFGKFCIRVAAAILMSFIGFLCYLLLLIVYGNKSRRIQI